MLVVDDAKNVADQWKDLLNAEIKVTVYRFTSSLGDIREYKLSG